MKIILFVMCMSSVLPTMKPDESHAYCESCLATAKAIEEEMKDVPAERRQRVVESLISGDVCEKLLTTQVPDDKVKSSCRDLLGSHYDQFSSALLTQEPKHLDIVLCYERSSACVGVKRLAFEDAKKRTFTERDIEALLQDNKEILRFSQPVPVGLPGRAREEL